MTVNGRPEFATNDPSKQETVAEAIKAMVDYEQHRPDLSMAIASAYFNVGGWHLISPALKKAGKVRIMLGAEPPRDTDPVLLRPETLPRNRAEAAVITEALTEQESALAGERNLTPFTAEAKGGVKALIEWLRGGGVEVRRYTKGFLHGKAYLLDDPALGVIAGSSNFTYAGMSQNRELNLGSYSMNTIGDVRVWFDGLWDESEDFDLAAFYETQIVPENPWMVFLRMLWEMYGRQIAQDDEDTEADPSLRLLMPFQKDGVARARRILEKHNGVLVADEVGLGKTFIGGALIKDAVRARQRVLIVAPKIIRDSVWRGFYLRNNPDIGGWVDVISYDDLIADVTPDGKRWRLDVARDPDEYALVLLDEAHTVRNTDTKTANALLEILRGNPRKRVVLMTATPVNNALGDLHSLLSYFIVHDDEFAEVGIPSLASHFKALDKLDTDDLAPEHLFDILDAVAVRRTRRFIRNHYVNQPIDAKGTLLVFPQPVVERVNYRMAPQLATFFDDFAHALGADRDPGEPDPFYDYSHGTPMPREGLSSIDANRLALAGYTPSRYLIAPDTKQYEIQVAGLLRSGLLKRLESSSFAFAQTCLKMSNTLQGLLDLINDQSLVATGEALRDFMRVDVDDLADLDDWLGSADYESTDLYDVDPLKADIANDIAILRGLAATVTNALPPTDDPKIQALADTLREIVVKATEEAALRAATSPVDDPEQRERDDRKVLVFSTFADTVYYVQDHVDLILGRHPELAVYQGRFAFVTGSMRKTPGHGAHAGTVDQDTAVAGFAPRTGGPVDKDGKPTSADQFDLLVTSDVLAEGVNLQQAHHIVNLDLPWNPQKLVQRHGRIDRIGSQHDYVYMWCFFPETDLDRLLGLEETLHRKIAKAAKSIGAGTIIPGQMEMEDRSFATTRDQITALASGDNAIFLGQTGSLISGEEFRAILRSAIENESLERTLEAMPWQIGSGFIAAGRQPGFVFCARILNRDDDPVLRYIALPPGFPLSGENPVIAEDVFPGDGRALLRGHPVDVVNESLTALTVASPPGKDTPAHLPDEIVELAYDAWAIAQSDIADTWNQALDPGNQPPVPAVVRQAVQHLRRHNSHRDTAEVDQAVKIYSRAQSTRVTAFVRAVMKDDYLTDALKTDRLIDLIDELGLVAPVRRVTRYSIEPDEVHLIAWMAVLPPAE